jgi:hypothetical protein
MWIPALLVMGAQRALPTQHGAEDGTVRDRSGAILLDVVLGLAALACLAEVPPGKYSKKVENE